MFWQAPDFFLQVCTSSCAPDSGGTKNRGRKPESRKQGGFMPGTCHPYPPLHTDLCTVPSFMCSFIYSQLQMVMKNILMLTEKQPMNPGNPVSAPRAHLLFKTDIHFGIRQLQSKHPATGSGTLFATIKFVATEKGDSQEAIH
jgi:hypothetical protein